MLQIGRTIILDFIICVLKKEKRRSSPYATQVCDNLLPIMGSLRFSTSLLSVSLARFCCRGRSSSGNRANKMSCSEEHVANVLRLFRKSKEMEEKMCLER